MPLCEPNPQQPEPIYWTWLDELQSSIHLFEWHIFPSLKHTVHNDALIINELHLEFDFVDSMCHVFFYLSLLPCVSVCEDF